MYVFLFKHRKKPIVPANKMIMVSLLSVLRFIYFLKQWGLSGIIAVRNAKDLVNTDVMAESRKEEIKDNNGNVLRVEEVKVPVLVRHYEIWRKCKHCGHLVKIFEDEKEEKYDRIILK